MITRDFDLWITQGHTKRLVFNANQYDQGETWRFRILGADGNPIVPTTAAIIGQKKDGHAILVEGTVSDGKVVITETEQMTACAGLTEFELLLNGETHGTANFTVQVEKRPGDDADFSDSDLSLIQDAVDAAETIVEVIGDSDPSEVIGEHVDAWLDNHPEATTTVQDGAITAPKINNSLWDKILVNEEASGAVASFDDGADDVPVSSLKVNLEPIQTGSGDPSPSNIRPIYSANGINRLSVDSVSCGGDNTRTKTLNIETISAGTYTFSAKIDATIANNAGIQFLDANSANVGSVGITPNMTSVQASVTLTGDAVKAYFYIGTTDHNNGKYLNITNMQMGVVNAPYQPYQGIMVERKGVNQWDEQWELGGISNQNGTNYGASDRIRSKNYIPCLPNTTYYFKTPAIMGTVAFYNSSQTFISALSNFAGGTFTTPANTQYIRFCGTNAYGATYNKDISINYPSIITDYHASTGNSYPMPLGREVYGGTVDLATGVLKVDMGYFTLNGSETWTVDNNGARVVTTALRGQIKPNTGNSSTVEGDITNMFLQTTPNMTYGGGTGFSVATNGNIHVSDGSTMTVEGWQSFLASKPLTLAMKLATPQTINLTPQEVKTLLGYNNISSSGTVDVIYHADTKLYVDKMAAVDNAIIAPTEADFVATRNYTTNDLVIVNDTLYKVTANIATGSAITPNSNVQQTTLSALIKALS